MGEEGILTPLIKQVTEAALEAELDSHLAQEVTGNRKNDKSKKTIKSLDGSFSPQMVKKHQTTISDELEQKIIALYGLGMSYTDISAHIK